MPITINGSGSVTGISVGGLPDGIVDTDTLAVANRGKIIQCISDDVNTQATAASNTSYEEITTAMRATISPKLATSKLIITFNLAVRGYQIVTLRIMKDGTSAVYEDATGFSDSSSRSNTAFYADGAGIIGMQIIQVEETAGSTSSRYYTPFWYSPSGHTMGFNRWTSDNANYGWTSSYQILEVAA